jgi:hypothetical protein
MALHQPDPVLLQLPDPCLLAVLHCCAADPGSLFSLARAHSRLRQAVAVAVNSISVTIKTSMRQQQQTDSLLLYLNNQGKHIGSLELNRTSLFEAFKRLAAVAQQHAARPY